MSSLPDFLTKGAPDQVLSSTGKTVRTPVLEKGVHHLAQLIQDSYVQWESSRRDGLLQALDPRIKVFFLALFLVVVSLKRNILPQIGITLFIALLAAASRLDMVPFYRRIGWTALLFGVLVPLPSVLNLFNDGHLVMPLIQMQHDYYFWQYHIPATIGVTREGLRGMVMLTLRIGNSIALSMLVLHTTSFPDMIKALRVFRMPESFIVVITLSYKYVFAFSRTVIDMHMAKRSRLLGGMDNKQSRIWASGRIASLFQKSQIRCAEIFKAMISRGFEHKITIRAFPPLNRRSRWAGGVALMIVAGILAW